VTAARRLVLAVALALTLVSGTVPPLVSGSAPAHEQPTFSEHVAPILQQRCQGCHRPGEHAPFPLLTYRDAYQRRDDIRDAVQGRAMPPWKPVPGFGDFLGSRRLSETELATVVRWIETGAPEGDPAKLPPPVVFPKGWTLGPPDHVFELPETYTVPARAGDVYRCIVIPTSFAEDRWVTKVEYAPGDRKLVHHILSYIDTTGAAERLDRADPGLGYTCFGGPGFMSAGGLSGWAPGIQPRVLEDGVGMLLPKGANVVLQIHYHNSGATSRSDRTRMALHFAKGPIEKRQRSIPILNRTFTIPSGERSHEVRASWTVPALWSLHANTITPHMHLLGRQMKVTATYPDGTVRPLIHVDDWDFNWQGTYTFAKLVPLPGGTRIDMIAVFDNSAENPRQPNRPPRPVSWGDGTTDEMAIVFLGVTRDDERIGWKPSR
jgi:mono/diheme cytochrome c family protein